MPQIWWTRVAQYGVEIKRNGYFHCSIAYRCFNADCAVFPLGKQVCKKEGWLSGGKKKHKNVWRDTVKQESKIGIKYANEYLENCSYIDMCLGKDRDIKLACNGCIKEELGKVYLGLTPTWSCACISCY